MDTIELRKANGITTSRLECPHDQAFTLPAFSIWPVSKHHCQRLGHGSNDIPQQILCHNGIEKYEMGRMDR